MIKRPNQERFDMTMEENMAFWFMIIAEYSHRYVRENSILLLNNNTVRTNDNEL
jgi:hypothetical protein